MKSSLPLPNKIRVLFVVTAYTTGGAERCLSSLIKALDRTKYEPILLALTNGRRDLLRFLKDIDDLNILDPPMRGKGDIFGIKRLVDGVRELKPHIVYAHLFHPIVLARMFLRGCVPILLSSYHNVNIGAFWRAVLFKMSAGRDDGITVPARAVDDYLVVKLNASSDRVYLLANGIEDFVASGTLRRADIGLPENGTVITMVGRLHPVKAHHLGIRAFAEIAPRFPDLRLVVVGDGVERANLERLANELGVSSRIHLLGFRDDIPDILTLSDIFLLPSRSEALPVSVIEAMRAGLPVIASRVGALPELVEDGESGILTEAGDVIGLSKALQRLLDDPTFGKRLGARGRTIFEAEYTADKMVSRTEQLFESLIERKLGIVFEGGAWRSRG